MKRIVIDLDDTITINQPDIPYEDMLPNLLVIKKMREYKGKGFQISIHTSRNMRTYNSNMGQINACTLPIILNWLEKHDVPFDEIFLGKPWCGNSGFYVDDKSIRPDEFSRLSLDEIYNIIGETSAQ